MTPMGRIAGFPVRPGLFDVNGAMALPNGVSFCFTMKERRSLMRCSLFQRNIRLATSIP